jgi:hypothetical protein
MRGACLVVFLSVGLALAQPTPKTGAKGLPPEAKKAVAAADAEVKKVRERLIDTLQKHLEAETKKGDLDAALAIRGEIERLKKVDATVTGGLTDEKGSAEVKRLLVGGRWRLTVVGSIYTAEWEFQDDGTVAMKDSTGKSEATWSVETQGKNQVLIIDQGPVHTIRFTLPQVGKRLVGIKPGNNKERVELVKQ